MPAVSHHGHKINVHFGYLPEAIIASATNFTVGGKPILRVGDLVKVHKHPNPNLPPHIGATIAAGAGSFSVGGKPAARIGDPTTCGAKIAQGFSTLTIG